MSDRVAILGAGKMGEALLSGMVRAGRPASGLVVTTHDERARRRPARPLRRRGHRAMPRQ